MKKNSFIVLFLIAMMLFACRQVDENHEISDAKIFFEQSAKTLSLPIIESPDTKTGMFNSMYPLWNEALSSRVDGRTIVEVPLSGPYKITPIIYDIIATKKRYITASSKSYLVVDYIDHEKPKMYVETFIQPGNKCTITASSCSSDSLSFLIISELSGKVTEKTAFYNNRKYSSHTDSGECLCSSKLKLNQYNVIGFKIAYKALAETKTCPNEDVIICSFCGMTYYGNIVNFDLNCPYCGQRYWDSHFIICPICGQPWDDCQCPDSQESCDVCGRHVLHCTPTCSSAAYCICE